MKTTAFPECCGAAIVSDFEEVYPNFARHGRPLSKDIVRQSIKRVMDLAHDPYIRQYEDEWSFGYVSMLVAITSSHQPMTATVLEELGWQKGIDAVKNVNSGNMIQHWHYLVPPRKTS